jgi:hypothetical protein
VRLKCLLCADSGHQTSLVGDDLRSRLGQPTRTNVSSGSETANSYVPHGFSFGALVTKNFARNSLAQVCPRLSCRNKGRKDFSPGGANPRQRPSNEVAPCRLIFWPVPVFCRNAFQIKMPQQKFQRASQRADGFNPRPVVSAKYPEGHRTYPMV